MIRDRFIGVGCQSVFAELAGVSPLAGSSRRRFTPPLSPVGVTDTERIRPALS
jgi:hypothetical protein